jgi:hypothetical protein
MIMGSDGDDDTGEYRGVWDRRGKGLLQVPRGGGQASRIWWVIEFLGFIGFIESLSH